MCIRLHWSQRIDFAFAFVFFSLEPQQDTAAGISKRAGYIAFLEAFFIFTSLEALPIFLNERNVFVRSVIDTIMLCTLHCEATLLHAHTLAITHCYFRACKAVAAA
jgi:hypothetical protein